MQNQPGPEGLRKGRFGPRKWRAALAAGVAAALLAACGSTSSSSSTAAPSTNSSSPVTSSSAAAAGGGSSVSAATAALSKYTTPVTSIDISTPLKSAPPSGKTVVMLGTNNPSNVQVQQALSKLSGIVHWNYSEVSYDPANPATFDSALQTAITKHANYIAEAGEPLTPAETQKAQAAGAKWVLSSVYPVTLKPPVLVDADSYAADSGMAKIMADFFVSDSGGKGNAVIEHIPAYPILGAFTATFQADVKSMCPACKTTLANISIPDLVAGKLPSQLVSALQSDSAANYLVFDDGPFAAGVESALKSAGLSSRVKIIGEAADQTAIAALKNGTNTAWTGFDPVYATYQMMDSMLRDAEGMPVSQALEGVQPTQLLTKATIGSVTNWSQPTNALSQFEKLWKVS